jgi:hypothetical protein
VIRLHLSPSRIAFRSRVRKTDFSLLYLLSVSSGYLCWGRDDQAQGYQEEVDVEVDEGRGRSRRYDAPRNGTSSTGFSIWLAAFFSAGVGKSGLALVCIITATTGIRF